MKKDEKRARIEVLAACRLNADGPKPLWRLPRVEGSEFSPVHTESVPLAVLSRFAFTADLRVVDLATGKVLDEVEDKTLAIRNGGYMQAMGNLVMTRIDGSHGSIHCGFFWIGDDGKIVRSAAWRHGRGWLDDVNEGRTVAVRADLHTTSYHHPLYYPMADGRLFVRGGDGIYCWDLRKPVTP
jgi:hypothetical protein